MLHHYRFGDWKACSRFSQGHNNLLHLPPFFEIRDNAVGTADVNSHLSALALFAPFAVGTAVVFPICVSFGIFTFVYLIFSASLWHIDIFRYALPGYVFALIVGFDEIWASKATNGAFIGLAPALAAVVFWYAMGQIGSNTAPPWFTEEVLRAPVAWR
jgi:hypothetical protein